MKRLFTLATFLLIFIGYGKSFEDPPNDEDLHRCYSKLICEMDKIEEFYGAASLAGPETSQRFVHLMSEFMNIKDPVNTLAYWTLAKDTFCEWSNERKKKVFNDWVASVGEHILEICIDFGSEICIKAESAVDQFAATFAKYQAMGACSEIPGEQKGIIPGGMGNMPSPLG